MIALAGKQRQMRLIPVKALDQPADTEWIKVADTKGCLLFATGVMRPTATTSTILSGSFCLCVAVKRQVLYFNILRIAYLIILLFYILLSDQKSISLASNC